MVQDSKSLANKDLPELIDLTNKGVDSFINATINLENGETRGSNLRETLSPIIERFTELKKLWEAN
jgi:hypothetical protein